MSIGAVVQECSQWLISLRYHLLYGEVAVTALNQIVKQTSTDTQAPAGIIAVLANGVAASVCQGQGISSIYDKGRCCV